MNISILKVMTLGVISLSLTACFNGDSNSKKVKENNAPTVVSEDLTTQADTAITAMLTASDVDMDALTYSVVSQPTNGTLTLDGMGDFTYQPNATVTGSDSFVFGVTDGESDVVTGTINITIEALQVNFSSYSRSTFAQSEADAPLPVNGREFTQDVSDPNAYDDLLNSQ